MKYDENNYFIKPGYKSRGFIESAEVNEGEAYWQPWRLKMSYYFQPESYRHALRIAKRNKIKSVLDIGCGPATKLVKFFKKTNIEICGVDQKSAIDYCNANYSKYGKFIVDDVENPRKDFDKKFDLILAIDIIEHLIDPDTLLNYIKMHAHSDTYIIISTPERDLHRGENAMSSEKPEHVREWNSKELNKYLSSSGFNILEQRNIKFLENAWWIKSVRENYSAVTKRTGTAYTTQMVTMKL